MLFYIGQQCIKEPTLSSTRACISFWASAISYIASPEIKEEEAFQNIIETYNLKKDKPLFVSKIIAILYYVH